MPQVETALTAVRETKVPKSIADTLNRTTRLLDIFVAGTLRASSAERLGALGMRLFLASRQDGLDSEPLVELEHPKSGFLNHPLSPFEIPQRIAPSPPAVVLLQATIAELRVRRPDEEAIRKVVRAMEIPTAEQRGQVWKDWGKTRTYLEKALSGPGGASAPRSVDIAESSVNRLALAYNVASATPVEVPQPPLG